MHTHYCFQQAEREERHREQLKNVLETCEWLSHLFLVMVATSHSSYFHLKVSLLFL